MGEIKEQNNAAGSALRAALKPALPVIVGFIFPGLAYGILMETSGGGLIWALLMSAVAFCGSMQYAAVPLLVAPFSPWGAFFLALMVNARHIFYGLSLLERYRGVGKIKFFLIYFLCDETFSVLCGTPAPQGVNDKLFCFFVSFLNYLSWSVFTVLGCLIGKFIPPDVQGLDFVLTALFAAIFLAWWDKPGSRKSALLGAFTAAVCRIIFGEKYFLLPTLVILTALLLIFRKKLEGGQGA